jgi:hypothetical protein
MRSEGCMPIDVVAIPTGYAASTLGDVLGPISALALGATLIALAVLVVGLVNEQRDAVARARMRAWTMPALARPVVPRHDRDAA